MRIWLNELLHFSVLMWDAVIDMPSAYAVTCTSFVGNGMSEV